MKKQIIGAALAAAMVATSVSALSLQRGLSAAVTGDTVNQPKLTAWYEKPAKDWESEATPLGNGFMGAMVFGGVESDRIQINEHTLWSGGPGADADYDGGMNGNPEATKEALQKVRQLLQDKMTEFSGNQAAYRDSATSSIVSADYAPEDAELQGLINQLTGEKDNFGDYQTFGNIIISDSAHAAPGVVEVTSNCEAYNEAEKYDKLFDGSPATKWYSAAGAPEGYSVPSPVWIAWKYNEPVTAKNYELISGNDVPERDPRDWKLYGSADGKTYELIDSRSGEVFTERNQSRTFELSKEVSCQYYKIEILSTYEEGTPCQLSEIKLGGGEAAAGEAPYDNYRRELDLDRGVAKVSYTQDNVDYTREYFINNPSNVAVIRLSSGQKGKLTKNIALTSEQTVKTITVQNDTITMTGRPADHREDGLKFAGQLKVINIGGTLQAGAESVDVRNADEILLIMTAGTNYQQCMDYSFDYFSEEDPLTAVSGRITAAAGKGWQGLYEEHVRDYTKLYDRVKLNLCDTAAPEKSTDRLLAGYNGRGTSPNTAAEDRYLELLYYQFGRYLLISSSREGSLPANLQGIWAQGLSSPWNSDYHTNINLQMNYWPAEQTNLAECHLPVIRYVNSLVPRGTITAQAYYTTQEGGDVRGWVIHHENNIWGNTAPGNYYWGFYFPAAAAWMCQDIWEYYAFSQDEQFLRDNYDTLLQAALFWVDNLWTDARDGKLVANPSFSPEHGPYSLGTAADQGIIWEIFEEVIKAGEVLGITSSELEEIKTAQSRLAGPQIGLAGQFLEWKDEITLDITGDAGHRHANHLYALHPGSQIVAGRSEEEDAYIEAMKNTLNTRGDGGTGWSKAWKINFWARLRDGNRAHKLVEELLSDSTLTNLFDTHPPFQIDGNFGATAGMTEMLLQSQGDSIDLLPSLPTDWEKGSFSGLKARGNFEISAVWEDKIARSFTITSNAGKECVLNYYGLSEAVITRLSDGKKVETEILDQDTISFETLAGETYVVGDIPQDKLFSDPREFMRSTLENLYDPAAAVKLGASDNKGTYIKTLPACSMANAAGLKENDLILSLNGQEIKNTGEFVNLYRNSMEGDIIRLKILRDKQEQYICFIKSPYEEYRFLPGQIEAEDYDEIYGNEMKTETCGEGGMNLGFIAGGDYVVFQDIIFGERPVRFNVRTAGTSGNKVTVRLDSYDGPVIAELFVTPTGEWQTYITNTTDIINREALEGGHDLYLILNAGMNVNWISFDGAGELMPDMELLLAQNTFLSLKESCKQLPPGEYTGESYLSLISVIEEAEAGFTLTTAVEQLQDYTMRLEEARKALIPAVQEASAPMEVTGVKEWDSLLPYIITALVFLLGGAVTIILLCRKGRFKKQ